MKAKRPIEHRGQQPSPRISGKAVQHRPGDDKAYYHRPANAPRHPDAAYSIPNKNRPGWRIDVILLTILVVAVVILLLL